MATRVIAGVLAGLVFLLAGCGGGGGTSTPSFSLGGTLAGLGSGQQLLLLSGAGTQVTLTANGNFRFPDRLPQGSKFGLVIQRQPLSQTCTVTNGTDAVGIKADVSNITVVCADNSAVLSGVASGIPPGASLTLGMTTDGTNSSSTTIGANGPFVMSVRPANGAAYAVTVTAQPQGASCAINNGAGTAGSAPISNLELVCSPSRIPIGGELLGLAQGQQVQLRLTGTGLASATPALALSSNGSFSFLAVTPGINFGGEYAVTVSSQPSGQTCTLSNATGVGITATVTQLWVSCMTNRHALGGTVTGLMVGSGGQPLVLRNASDTVSVSANGPFLFPTLLTDGAGYSVSIAAQPSGQTCSLLNDFATAVNAPVRTVVAQCLSFVWRTRLLAGSGVAGSLDDVGALARFSGPSGVALGPRGDLIVSDFSSSRIRSVMMPLGLVSTLAGSSVPGLVDARLPLAASFRAPVGVAVDSAGHVYVADSGNHVIRRIAAGSGEVSTWAGSGVAGYSNGTGASAQFNGPRGLAFDTSGNLYVADTGNHVIRRISPTGVVSLYAGSPKVGGRTDGPAGTFNGPVGLAVAPQGTVYVADTQNHSIRAISTAGIVSTIAGAGAPGAQDGTGGLGSFSFPTGVALDGQASIFVADAGNHSIRQIQLIGGLGTVLTIAGTGTNGYREGVGAAAAFDQPNALVIDSGGNLIIAEGGGNRLRILYRSPN